MSYRSVFRSGLFEHQCVLVTGGGSGIGRCIAHELASLGARVVLVGRTLSKLEAVAQEIADDGGEAHVEACDIRDEQGVRALVGRVVAAHGRVHALVNNAGGQYASPLSGITKKGFEAVVGTNLTGGFLMAREVFTQSMEAHGGSVVNMVADMWRGMPGMAHSGAARAGMVNLTQTAAVEWARAGVRVNAVAPGLIASSGLDTYPEYIQQTLPALKTSIPLKRFGTESEVSAAVCFLLSPAASFITGTCLNIDGAGPLAPTNLFPIPAHTSSTPFDGFHRAVTPKALRDADAEPGALEEDADSDRSSST